MFYINNKQERYPKVIFDRFNEERKEGFISISDEEHSILFKKLNEEQKTFNLEKGKIVYKDKIILEEDLLYAEKAKLHKFLDKSNYIIINLGKRFTIEERTEYLNKISKKFNITNLEVINKQEETIKRINELDDLIKSKL